MAAYNSTQKRIKNALKTIVADITYDTGSGSEPAFVSVLDSTAGQFDGYPAVRIFPAHIDNDKGAIDQSDRAPRYTIRTHVPLEDTVESGSQAFDQMYDLTELLLDALDDSDVQDSINALDPGISLLLIEASQGDWDVTIDQAGSILMFDIDCKVKYSRSF